MEQGKSHGAPADALADYDAVCGRFRAALEPARAHSISLHDEHGEVLWLSEGSLGPDEHDAVRQALDAFGDPNEPAVRFHALGDTLSAALLRVVGAHRTFVGLVMLVVDARFARPLERAPARLITPKLQMAIAEFAELRSQLLPAAAAPPRAVASPPAVAPPRAPAPPPAAARPSVPPQMDRLHEALRRTPLSLHVQRLVPLVKGSQLTRFEVLLRSPAADAPNAAPQAMLKTAVEHGLGSMIDRRVVTELIGWLVRHPEVWRSRAMLFSVNLTVTALHDEHFLKFVELCLIKAALPRAMIGFEVEGAVAARFARQMPAVAAALVRLDCPLVLDDFMLRTECFELLRLPGVRYLKFASAVTARMRTDKVAQASITAMVQMARVLGMHTVAKRTETVGEQEWLTALGVDFVQSHTLSPPEPLESLARAAPPRGPGA